MRDFKKSVRKLIRKPQTLLSSLKDDSGVAFVEFAMTAPIFLTLGILGLDTANYVITHMRVSQIAIHVADNASRVGEHNVLVSRRVFESNVNDLLAGADRYAGGLNLEANGRVIISSLEQNSEGGQWIHWQRCFGDKDHSSSYGVAGDGETGTTFPGMGRVGGEIQATSGEAVMFVEVAYDYEAVSPFSVLDGNEITYTGAFNVRDSRDLTQIHQSDPAAPVADCS